MLPKQITGRARMAGVVAGVLLVGILLGAGLRGMGQSSSEPVRSQRPAPEVEEDDGGHEDEASSDDTGIGPSSSVGGVGVGWEQSERGAVAAAMSYAAAPQSWLYLSDEEAMDAAASVIAERSQQNLVDPMVQDLGLLRDEVAGADSMVWFVVSPLAVRVESYTATRAAVSVWTVRVLSADGVAVPQSGWQTLAFDLEWDGDWKVVDYTEVEGPTPQLEAGLQPWASDYLDDELSGFVRVGVL